MGQEECPISKINEIKRSAMLAKLALDQNALEAISGQITDLLDYARILGSMPPVDTSLEQPGTKVRPKVDKVLLSSLSQEEVIALAPNSHQGLIRVPRVVEDEF